MVRSIIAVATLVVAALSLGLSFAHLLEAGPRLTVWPPELWREATVFHGQYDLFGSIGGALDVGVIPLTALAAYLIRRERPGVWLASLAALLFSVSLAVWFARVAPVNAVLATWTPGPIPADFTALRDRWETGHMIMAGIKLAGFTALAAALVRPGMRITRPS
jgi:hypothetical protein